MNKYITALLIVLMLSACGSKTTVILLPNADGNSSGAVIVQTDQAEQVIDTPFTAATASSKSAPPSLPRALDREHVLDEYKDIIASEPEKPISFTLHFISGGTKLTKESKQQIPTILAEAAKRFPSEISIIGHTDSTGSKALNNKLSLQRAKAAEKMLKDAGADMTHVFISYHGENDPLVATRDNVAEPKNRRVEIMIR